jgi:hypothetical protein
MGDGTRLAVAILILFLAMVAFFFAFHPSGVAKADGSPVDNPADILQWLFDQWDTTTTGGGSPPTAAAVQPNTSVPSTDLTNVPGTNIGPLWHHYSSKAYQFSRV